MEGGLRETMCVAYIERVKVDGQRVYGYYLEEGRGNHAREPFVL